MSKAKEEYYEHKGCVDYIAELEQQNKEMIKILNEIYNMPEDMPYDFNKIKKILGATNE